MSGGTNTSYGQKLAYSYSIPATNGYYANGNLQNITDSVTGTWGYVYDNLNRVTQANGVSGAYAGIGVAGVSLTWSYDSFGNRLGQTSSTGNFPTDWAHIGTNNQVTASNFAPGGVNYDSAGDITYDGRNSYLYDAEGRICAVSSPTGFTQYIYDAEGNRVAKGSVNDLNCNLATNGFSLTNSYVLGLGGEQVTELGPGGTWLHSNVFANGALLATYAGSDTYFALNDSLGTKRVEVTPDGLVNNFASLPFGDFQSSTGNAPDATEQHFTGKQRDTDTGLDYFGARYYDSSSGRFMSPDWSDPNHP